ncbi:MAG: class I mannose-6-phosphate isomerase [Anaerolineae bacterium]|nr:class I mannose-6-phosphate isomerase [Anaerolineae bacterium]
MPVALYPLIFEPAFYARPWGGKQMEERLGKELPPGPPIGESWEIFWKNKVSNGEHRGRTLGELVAAYPVEMIGRDTLDAEYPLLVKFLDAQEWLSVQVHPDDILAAELEGQPRGKTECWYVIAAAPGAQVAFGLSEKLDSDSLRAAIDAGRSREIMQYVEVQAGDFIFVSAGTMHALGPGLLIYELQQTSDTTYRVYDWDRLGLDGKPRELHLEKAIAVTKFEVNPPAKINYQMREVADGVEEAELIRGQYFTLHKLNLSETYALSTNRNRAHLITALTGHVEWRSSTHAPLLLPQGTSAFLPAGVGDYTLTPDGDAEVLIAWES